eukprot:CAMPEP_0176124418 /NCGR_PEP_ID=MMETSP0120_2-20121206/62730_1 /TAXON_ID=160619 /ORGANISM="Kryptoperidinium foliaceum, Strain CCMP 1326" /LENGTH=51 /DNA_ID=CAMNT_0017459193 /DNA_START=6 /DNA_END=157 /DNA_ORIENTATION=+
MTPPQRRLHEWDYQRAPCSARASTSALWGVAERSAGVAEPRRQRSVGDEAR